MDVIVEGKLTIGIVKYKNFKDWLQEKMSLPEFRLLKADKQKELFLFWAYRSSDTSANFAEYSADNNYYFNVLKKIPKEQWENMEQGLMKHLLMEKSWIEHLHRIWKSIEDRSFFTQGHKIIDEIEQVFPGSTVE